MKKIVLAAKKDTISVDRTKTIHVTNTWIMRYIKPRYQGNLADKTIYLPPIYKWVLGVDDEGEQCLMPLVKED